MLRIREDKRGELGQRAESGGWNGVGG